jgi:hypothetical protein
LRGYFFANRREWFGNRWQAIKEKQYAAVQLAEEKIDVANQAYELIDSYIRMLGGGGASSVVLCVDVVFSL